VIVLTVIVHERAEGLY